MTLGGRAGCRHIRPAHHVSFYTMDLPAADTDHVESNDIAKGDLAGFVSLHENAVDDLWAATGRKTEHKRLLRCGIERFDPAWFESQLYASAFPGTTRSMWAWSWQDVLIMYSAMYSETPSGSSRIITLLFNR